MVSGGLVPTGHSDRIGGLVELSKAQVELLTRFRCSKWQQEEALPALPSPLASSSPVKRRSARIRTAPASYTPFFSQRRFPPFLLTHTALFLSQPWPSISQLIFCNCFLGSAR